MTMVHHTLTSTAYLVSEFQSTTVKTQNYHGVKGQSPFKTLPKGTLQKIVDALRMHVNRSNGFL